MWQTLKRWYHLLGSPPVFYDFAGKLIPWMLVPAILLTLWGLYDGLVLAPPDYQQKDSFRIIYVHVPAAWMSMMIYGVMALAGTIALVWRMKIAEIVAMSCAAPGAGFTLIALATGSLWGKPMWGTWWEWDARLTSELFLLFLYLGVMALYNAIEDSRKAARAASLLALVGVVNLPIIHFSVKWWNTLHQGTTVRVFGESAIHPDMLRPLLVMAIATKFYFAAAMLIRARTMTLELEKSKNWVRERLGL